MTALGDCPHAPEVLAAGADLLDGLGVHWWLSSGTALGVHRDGGLIPWDTDLDVEVLDGPGLLDTIDTAFRGGGFEPVRAMPYQRAYRSRRVVFDIYAYRRAGDELVADTEHGRLTTPSRLVEHPARVEFADRVYPMPNPVEEYLTVRYGPDWSTPRRSKRPWHHDAANLV